MLFIVPLVANRHFVFERSAVGSLVRVMRVMHFISWSAVTRFSSKRLVCEDFFSDKRSGQSCRKLRSHSTCILITGLAVFADYSNLLSVNDFVAYL